MYSFTYTNVQSFFISNMQRPLAADEGVYYESIRRILAE